MFVYRNASHGIAMPTSSKMQKAVTNNVDGAGRAGTSSAATSVIMLSARDAFDAISDGRNSTAF